MLTGKLGKTRQFGLALLAGTMMISGSWLLVADPSIGGNRAPALGKRTQRAPQSRGARHERRVSAPSHYYGYGSGVCRTSTLLPLTRSEESIGAGAIRCYQSNGNQTGQNADMSTEVFIAKLADTPKKKKKKSQEVGPPEIIQVTNDHARCMDGSKAGSACRQFSDCPGGRCMDASVGDCAAESSGQALFFIFDGNPLGQNADLGDELFGYDITSGTLTQLTVQSGWCSDALGKACTTSEECGNTGRCLRATMYGLDVAAAGTRVWFVTTGDVAGQNPGHGPALFATTEEIKKEKVKVGKKKRKQIVVEGLTTAFAIVGSGGKYCALNTQNAGDTCLEDKDCGDVCGDGKKGSSEECEFGYGSGSNTCTGNTFCVRSGLPNQCTCQAPVCGNGIVEPGERCDGEASGYYYSGCPRPNSQCSSDCTRCESVGSPGRAFLGVTAGDLID